MKKLLLTIISVFALGSLFAQNTTIAPNYVLIPATPNAPTCAVIDKGKQYFNTTTNKMYFCNGTAWVDFSVGAFALPYAGIGNSPTTLFSISNSGNGNVLNTSGKLQLTGIGEGAGKVLTSDAYGNAAWHQVPEAVNWLGAYSNANTYAMNDLVSSTTPNLYFYSLSDANVGHTPETFPTFWQPVEFEQLKLIHKVLTLNSPGFISLISMHLTGTHTTGGRIQYTVRATDGGSQIATEEGIMQYLATANSITCTVQVTDKLHLGTVNSGCTPGFFNPSSQPGVSIFDNVSFSSPSPILIHDVYFRVFPAGGQTISGATTKTLYRIEP